MKKVWLLHYSLLLCHVIGQVTDVLGQRRCPIFKGLLCNDCLHWSSTFGGGTSTLY